MLLAFRYFGSRGVPQWFCSIWGLAFIFLAQSTVGQPLAASSSSSSLGFRRLAGHLPAAAAQLPPVGALPASQHLNLAITLPLRDPDKLALLLHDLYDPKSPNYRHYLTPQQFTARFGASDSDYAAVMDFARRNQLTISATHPNRLVLDINASVSDIERAFHFKLKVYKHPTETRSFFAPDNDPLVENGLAIQHISGLDNYWLPRPNHKMMPLDQTNESTPQGGSGPGGAYRGNDFRTAYVPGTSLTGVGQSVGLLEFDGYYPNDIATYQNQIGLSKTPQLVNVAIDGGVAKPGSGNSEVSLDIEMVFSMAPGISTIYVYEAPNPSPWVDLLSRMANDNLSRQLSCSWGGGGPDSASETIFQQMAAQGQSFFNATGDSDAFTGAIPFPSDSPNIIQVGGTTLTTSSGSTYSSEQVWNWGRGSGSSGGISTYYSIPTWQQDVAMAANSGSSSMRNVPDVALTADNIYVTYNNGSAGSFGGTSCAAPLWAAFTALANQWAASAGLPAVGFLNPALYGIGTGSNYATCFHDVTAGNNTWTRSRTQFYATAGYDLCTGWGTPNGTNLINALVPIQSPPPIVAFSASPTEGPAPLMVTFTDNSSGNISQRSWDFGNGLTTNTTATSFVFPYATPGTNSVTLAISGPGGTNSLTQTAYIVVTNPISIIPSNPPTITSQPQNLILLAGSDATFSVQAGGDIPLSYQWRFNSTGISGATNTSYTRLNVQLADAGLYDVVVTNASGSITSSIAQLNIVSRPLLVDAGLSTNSSFQFTLSGDSGFNYVIEGTTNLSDWLSVATLSNAFGQVLYSDTNFSNAPFVAFRARLLLP